MGIPRFSRTRGRKHCKRMASLYKHLGDILGAYLQFLARCYVVAKVYKVLYM